jgi:hypothetical protein
MTTLADTFERAMRGDASVDLRLSRCTPAEIRVAVADLVARDDLLLAGALGVAALSFYPDHEDILATCALLAEVRQDWAEADQLLSQMVSANGMSATATTWLHWIRVVQCRLQTERAMQLAQLAVHEHPGDVALRETMEHLSDTLLDEQLMPRR